MSVNIKTIPFQPEGPQPLVCEPPDGDPYPVGALGCLEPVVLAVQGETLAPAAIAGQSALACASLAVQGHADVETLGSRSPLSLFSLTIARSGERKSTVDDRFMKPIREFEEAAAKEHFAAIADWENEAALWDAKHQQALDKAKKALGADANKAKAELHNLDPKPLPPPNPELTVTEPTFEGLVLALWQGRPSLGIFSDEGGQFLGGYAMGTDNRQKTLTALNSIWGGKSIKRTRRGDGVFALHGRRVAMHMLAQPDVARKFYQDGLAEDTGFLARFLITQPPSTIGGRLYGLVKHDPAAMAAYETRMKVLLSYPLPVDEQTRALQPRLLPLSQDAKEKLISFADELEKRQASHGDLSNITAAASKAAEQAARTAAVLTLWADLDATRVEADLMDSGIVLARYYLGEAIRLASAASMSEELADAETLRVWLLESFQHAEVLPRDVQKDGPIRQLRTNAKARAALTTLEKHGWLLKLEPGTLVRGSQRKDAWKIVD